MRGILLHSICALAALCFISPGAQASLINRGGGLIYDDVLDITWLQDANYAQTSGYDADGQMNWSQATTWADALVYTNAGGTYTDWRLASMSVSAGLPTGDAASVVDCSSSSESDCRDNEYGYLFYQYGISQSSPGLFTNVQGPEPYWSGTGKLGGGGGAWNFNFFNGTQGNDAENYALPYAWAVLDGDVAAVPVPAAFLLFGSALGLVSWMRRKKP